MDEYPVIYLSAICERCADLADGRTWCQHDNGPCPDPECGKEWTRYVLAPASQRECSEEVSGE
jgi:hypothetical protein